MNSELEQELAWVDKAGERSYFLGTTLRAAGGGNEPGPGCTGFGNGGRQRPANNDRVVANTGSSPEDDEARFKGRPESDKNGSFPSCLFLIPGVIELEGALSPRQCP